MAAAALALLVSALLLAAAHTQEMETVTGTIYCNNNATLYVNGKLVARDPVTVVPHNAYNVTFEVSGRGLPRSRMVGMRVVCCSTCDRREWSFSRRE